MRAIVSGVDWPCQLLTRYADQNRGCKLGVSGAITWFFEHEAEGLILEDDCLPSPDLFQFIRQLLERYRHDTRIGVVCGTALGDLREVGAIGDGADIVFSRYPSVWGWATWRRVWQQYDVQMASWPQLREDINGGFRSARMARVSTGLLERTFAGQIDTWDYQLSFLLWSQSQLAVIPRVNLVENVGFGVLATHSKPSAHPLAALSCVGKTRPSFPLLIPEHVLPSVRFEAYIERIATHSVISRFNRLLNRLWSRLISA